jgi:hypothetical protein
MSIVHLHRFRASILSSAGCSPLFISCGADDGANQYLNHLIASIFNVITCSPTECIEGADVLPLYSSLLSRKVWRHSIFAHCLYIYNNCSSAECRGKLAKSVILRKILSVLYSRIAGRKFCLFTSSMAKIWWEKNGRCFKWCWILIIWLHLCLISDIWLRPF